MRALGFAGSPNLPARRRPARECKDPREFREPVPTQDAGEMARYGFKAGTSDGEFKSETRPESSPRSIEPSSTAPTTAPVPSAVVPKISAIPGADAARRRSGPAVHGKSGKHARQHGQSAKNGGSQQEHRATPMTGNKGTEGTRNINQQGHPDTPVDRIATCQK